MGTWQQHRTCSNCNTIAIPCLHRITVGITDSSLIKCSAASNLLLATRETRHRLATAAEETRGSRGDMLSRCSPRWWEQMGDQGKRLLVCSCTVHPQRVINPSLLLARLEQPKLCQQQKCQVLCTDAAQPAPRGATSLSRVSGAPWIPERISVPFRSWQYRTQPGGCSAFAIHHPLSSRSPAQLTLLTRRQSSRWRCSRRRR